MELMEEENIYERIGDILGFVPENINILEESVDVELQLEYFEFSKKLAADDLQFEISHAADILFGEKSDFRDKRVVLAQLARIDEVDAYRLIEKYLKSPDKELVGWAVLAFQESRIILQNKLLDDNQVYISTGLGGKDESLRFFIALTTASGENFNLFQQKIVDSEMQFIFKRNNSVIEEVMFIENYCTIKALIPFRVFYRTLISELVSECNQYGGFLKKEFLVTNVKILTLDDISKFFIANT